MGIKERKERERNERRKQILGASRKIFIERGYSETRMEDIAEAAELATSALYSYFRNKDELYATLCEEGLDILNDMLEDASRKGGNYVERFKSIAGAYIRFYKEYYGYYNLITFEGLGFRRIGLPAELEERITTKSDAAIAKAEELVKAGMEAGDFKEGNPRAVAFFFWAIFEGLFFVHRRGFMDSWSLDLDETIELFNTAMQSFMSDASKP